MLLSFLSGATMLGAWAISVFFFRFHKTTGDRLFGFFSMAFLLIGAERAALEFLDGNLRPYVYFIRLLAFLLILIAILDKNRRET